MNAEGTRGHPLKSYQRRKAALDLNVVPRENRNHEGNSTQIEPWPLQTNQVIMSLPPTAIGAEEVDDDVILISSPRAIAKVKNKFRINRGRTDMVDLDSGQTTRLANNGLNKRRRIPPNQQIIDCDTDIISETCVNSSKWKCQKPTQLPPAPPPPPPPPPPPAEPAVSCPICMHSLIDEWVSTKCGHIFCKACISQAIAKQAKCPTCRKKVSKNALLRVFLPSNR